MTLKVHTTQELKASAAKDIALTIKALKNPQADNKVKFAITVLEKAALTVSHIDPLDGGSETVVADIGGDSRLKLESARGEIFTAKAVLQSLRQDDHVADVVVERMDKAKKLIFEVLCTSKAKEPEKEPK